MEVRDLPTLNAILNATAALLLVVAYIFIRQGKRQAHRNVMIAACIVSAAFLTSYLIYHFQVGSVRFQRTGTIRSVYLSILLTHTVLAASVPVLVFLSLRRAFAARFRQHQAISRWTLPIWLYVSVTGVIVYWMLYQM